MAKIMDHILPIVSILRYWAIILGSFGGPGEKRAVEPVALALPWMLPALTCHPSQRSARGPRFLLGGLCDLVQPSWSG